MVQTIAFFVCIRKLGDDFKDTEVCLFAIWRFLVVGGTHNHKMNATISNLKNPLFLQIKVHTFTFLSESGFSG